eukprot:g37974.t1
MAEYVARPFTLSTTRVSAKLVTVVSYVSLVSDVDQLFAGASCNPDYSSLFPTNLTPLPVSCIADTKVQCYQDQGTGYRGTWSITRSGAKCLNWNSTAVSRTRYNGRRPDAQQMGLGNHNYCRNPDNDTVPWCHVYNGHILTWDKCSISACPKHHSSECYAKTGADYRGTRSYSQSGSRCLNWDSEAVRHKQHNAWVHNAHHLGLGSHSHCRNPDQDFKPWCFIMKGRKVIREYCNIEQCISS